MKHKCWQMTNGRAWQHDCICNGRVHEPGCTSRKDKNKDCCPERHKMLHDAGHVKGLADDSFFMWHPDFPLGWHPNDIDKPKS